MNCDTASPQMQAEPAQYSTAQLMVKCLEKEGVEYIFGIPGEENLQVIEALIDSPIEFVTTRHEQGAAFMADVYGRLTGKPGVCLSTLGPGATNLMTGVADAQLDCAPLVAITGQVGTDRMHFTSHQYLDLVAMFKPVTKWNRQIVRPDTVVEIVRTAFHVAESEKPGATHIDLPENIASMSAEGEPMEKVVSEKSFASYQSIEKAAVAISRAKNPLILSGNGSIRGHASDAIREMSHKLKIPVCNTFMGKGVIPFTSKYYLGTMGIPNKDYINRVLEKTDLVIAIGYDLVEYSPQKWNANARIPVIHIGMQHASINKAYRPVVEIVGDISDSVSEIVRRSNRDCESEYAFSIHEEMEAEFHSYATDTAFPMKPQKILYDVRRFMGEDDILISDVGAHKIWIARHYNCYEPNTCIISNGFASMGIAIPGAMAAKLVHPDKKVLAVTGDGGFMMNNQELETALRCKLPFVVLIFRDDGYGLIKWKQQKKFGRYAYTEFSNPDFKLMAESMGLKGYRISSAEEFYPTLEEAFRQNIPAVIDCPVDYAENLKLDIYLSTILEEEKNELE
jgi:acetolactate synthase I/II/III large subunit